MRTLRLFLLLLWLAPAAAAGGPCCADGPADECCGAGPCSGPSTGACTLAATPTCGPVPSSTSGPPAPTPSAERTEPKARTGAPGHAPEIGERAPSFPLVLAFRSLRN